MGPAARVRLLATVALLGATACIEDALDYYKAHHDAGAPGGPVDSGPPGDSGNGPDSGPPDGGGLRDSGLADSGPRDAGASDAGAADSGASDSGPADGGGEPDGGGCVTNPCTSDWATFLRCGPLGQRLCLPSTFLFPGQAAFVAVHGPADNVATSAVAFANGSDVWVGFGADGGIFLTAHQNYGSAVSSLAVSDGHDVDGTHTACAVAMFSLASGEGFLGGCAQGLLTSGTFAGGVAGPVASGLSWIPVGGKPNLMLASASPPASILYFDESSIPTTPGPQPQWPAFDVQGISGGPDWLLAQPDGGLGGLSYLLIANATTPVSTPQPLSPADSALTAAAGGAAVVALANGVLAGFFVNASLLTSPIGSFDAGAAVLGGIGRLSSSMYQVRVAFLDAGGSPGIADLDGTNSPPTWTPRAAPAAANAVYAAPIDPHMLLLRDAAGNLSIGYLP
jgi:hypothetical protein